MILLGINGVQIGIGTSGLTTPIGLSELAFDRDGGHEISTEK